MTFWGKNGNSSDAILAIIPDEQWVLRGEPTTENEFNAMFRRIIGEEENGTAIESDNPDNWVYRGPRSLRRRPSLMLPSC